MTLSHSFWKGYGSNGRESWRKDFPTLIPIFHRCNLIRSRMMHVVNNLSAYLMFEVLLYVSLSCLFYILLISCLFQVLESAWLHLQSQMKTAKCLDDIIIAHDNYLSDILDRGLLTPAYENLNMQV